MSNKINRYKNRTYYFFNNMINIKSLDINKIKIDEKSSKNILIYHIGYATVKDLSYATINTANPLYLIINRINGNIEESNGNKYLTLVPTDKSQRTLKNIKDYGTKLEIVYQ